MNNPCNTSNFVQVTPDMVQMLDNYVVMQRIGVQSL